MTVQEYSAVSDSATAKEPPPAIAAVRFELIDLLRGFAAITVLLYHTIECCGWKDFPTAFPFAWFRHGWLGVDIFFVISGFVITLSALNLRNQSKGSAFFPSFMKRRLKRIAPLHYLTVLAFVLLSAKAIDTERVWDTISHLLFIHNWFPAWHRSINPVNWTLGAEMQFYALIALLIPFINYNTLKYYVFGSLLITYSWRYWAWSLTFGASPETTFVMATQLPGMLDLFISGILLAYFTRTRTFANFKKSRLSQFVTTGVIIGLGWWAAELFSTRQDFWPHPYMMVFFRTLPAAVIALTILLLCTIRTGKIAKILLSPFVYIGTISYGIYLFHWPIIQKVNSLAVGNNCKLTIIFLATIILAAASWHFFEKRFLPRKPPTSQQTDPNVQTNE